MADQNSKRFDIAYIGDFREANNGTIGVADEIDCHAAAGYSTVLVPLADPDERERGPVHRALERCVRQGRASVAGLTDTTMTVELAIVPNPIDLLSIPDAALRLEASRTVMIAQDRLTHGDGSARYNLEDATALARSVTGGEVAWAPAWPATRAQLESKRHAIAVSDIDWGPVFSEARWARVARWRCNVRPTIGRHATPDPKDWPASLGEFLKVYPLNGHLRIALLGAPTWLLRMLGTVPKYWTIFLFGSLSPERFIASLDYFVLPGHQPLGHAIDRGILEALAGGAVGMLPDGYDAYFGEAALYGPGGPDALEQMTHLHSDKEAFRSQSERGREFVLMRHGSEVHLRRLHFLIGDPRQPPAFSSDRCAGHPGSEEPNGSILFVSTNGVGLGHVTRQLAIAKRLPAGISPVFATMTQGLTVLRRAGYHAEYIPFHEYLGCDVLDWNTWLAQHLARLIERFKARVLIFDGQFPYQGLKEAIGWTNGLKSVWCRRAMWQRPVWPAALEGSNYFDLVIEPSELAESKDRGATLPYRGQVKHVPPITLLDDSDLLTRQDAREALALDLERPAVLLQLGSGHLPDIVPAFDWMVSRLTDLGRVQIVAVDWISAERSLSHSAALTRLSEFPNARYFRAFDFVVSAAGYNSFHELLKFGVPTVFVPLEVDYLDNHLGRAQFAAEEGMALCLRLNDLKDFAQIARQALDPKIQSAMAAACRRRWWPNGADDAAVLLAELMGRTDPPERDLMKTRARSDAPRATTEGA